MKNYKKITKESNAMVALVILCQDYVLFDDELLSEQSIKRKIDSEDFWLELAAHLNGTVKDAVGKQKRKNMKDDEFAYDDFEEISVKSNEVLSYVLDPENRLDLNDMILDTVENWLAFKGNR